MDQFIGLSLLMRSSSHLFPILRRAGKPLLPLALAFQLNVAAAYDLTYLQSLLGATAVGEWVQVNTNRFNSAVASGSSALPNDSYTNPGSIVRAWSSMAWDSSRGQLYVWGGGHANYIGNEMHVWDGKTGAWALGSLPSRIQNVSTAVDPRTWVVVDGAAPQSAHTYDGNQYLPVNDYFLTFGDAVYNTGSGFQTLNAQGQLVKAGPWLWDPTKADPSKVGGTTGSGYDPEVLGGGMWINRQGQWTGSDGAATSLYSNNTSAYRTENGRDVVYVTKQSPYSGWPDLYRYTLGDVRNGGVDQWEKVGVSLNVPSGESTAVIDDANNLYVQTTGTKSTAAGSFALHVWDLDAAGANNRDIGVELVDASGNKVRFAPGAGIGYSDNDGVLWLWDGAAKGVVWRTKATYNADGTLAAQWLVEKLVLPAGAEQPAGSFVAGVFGKWQYVSELGAFIALDEYNLASGDAGVWLYKTTELSVPVPEVGGVWLMMLGLGGLSFLRARNRQTG